MNKVLQFGMIYKKSHLLQFMVQKISPRGL